MSVLKVNQKIFPVGYGYHQPRLFTARRGRVLGSWEGVTEIAFPGHTLNVMTSY